MILLVVLFAAIPAALFCFNLFLYRDPPQLTVPSRTPISVLIPARNEEISIAAAVTSVLASTSVDLELIVLDDASTDRTAQIVLDLAKHDPRLRLERAPTLPNGWNGKQHACYVLASLANHPTLCFLDADVRIDPSALARMARFMTTSGAALVSGFPRQDTGTWLEQLLIPLIHFVLLSYLPLAAMRRYPISTGFAAGCGQFLMVQAEAYRRTGGHRMIKTTMHDGLLLPNLFRQHGFTTDLADLTRSATCRMYRSAREVWDGLSKNATEGIAAPTRIIPFTLLLAIGQIAPFVLLPFASTTHVRHLLVAAICALYVPRILGAIRFRQSWLSALLHPIGIAVLLALEWNALYRKLRGRKATWKSRAYQAG